MEARKERMEEIIPEAYGYGVEGNGKIVLLEDIFQYESRNNQWLFQTKSKKEIIAMAKRYGYFFVDEI